MKSDCVQRFMSSCVQAVVTQTFTPLMFNADDPNDIYGNLKNENHNEVHLELLILKRNKKLFMLILSSKYDGIYLRQKTLYNLLFK